MCSPGDRRADFSTGWWPGPDPFALRHRHFRWRAGGGAPLGGAAEERGSGDFPPLWAGEAAALAREKSAETLTHSLWTDALAVMRNLNQFAPYLPDAGRV